MAAKTSFNKEEMSGLLMDFDLGDYQDHKPFEEGKDQTNYLVITSKGKYAFRYYEKRSMKYVLFEIDLLQYLAGNDFPCPSPMQNKHGDYAGVYKDKPYAFFTFIEGTHENDADDIGLAADAIGRLDFLTYKLLPRYFDARPSYGIEYCWEQAWQNSTKIASKDAAAQRLDWLKRELDVLVLSSDLPKGVCHGDCNPGNFLYKHDSVSAVLDFDQANHTFLLYDLASLIYWWTWSPDGEIDFTKAKRIVKDYAHMRPLHESEKMHLFDMLKLINLISYAWFIHDDNDYPKSQKRVEQLTTLGRKIFHDSLFGS